MRSDRDRLTAELHVDASLDPRRGLDALTLGEEVKPYAEIGSLFGVTEQQIRIEVFRLRRRLAEFLRAEVAATMQSGQGAAAVEDETRHLIRALAYEPAS